MQQSWRVLWRAVWFIWVKSSKFLKCSWHPMSVTQKYTCMIKHLSLGLLTSIKRPVFLCNSQSILFEVLCKNEREWGNYIFCFRCWKTASPVVVLVSIFFWRCSHLSSNFAEMIKCCTHVFVRKILINQHLKHRQARNFRSVAWSCCPLLAVGCGYVSLLLKAFIWLTGMYM